MLLIRATVIAACLAGARSADPNEFIGLVEGEKKKAPAGSSSRGDDLLLTRLVVPPGLRVNTFSAHFSPWEVPFSIDYMGVFHSHPSRSNRPSRMDSMSAAKEGGVQLIACRPYNPENLAAYDANGKPVPYRIVP